MEQTTNWMKHSAQIVTLSAQRLAYGSMPLEPVIMSMSTSTQILNQKASKKQKPDISHEQHSKQANIRQEKLWKVTQNFKVCRPGSVSELQVSVCSYQIQKRGSKLPRSNLNIINFAVTARMWLSIACLALAVREKGYTWSLHAHAVMVEF